MCLLCFCASMPALADSNDINNPSFELFDYNSPLDFNIPRDWGHVKYTAVVNCFNKRNPDWNLDPVRGLLPYDGNYFVILSTGDFSPEPNYAELRQPVTINAGDRITGAYFFGTYDYMSFNDWGTIQLVQPGTNIVEANIVRVCIADIKSYRSMRGWQRFDYVFDINGNYDLRIFVSDYEDFAYNSYFAVDGLVICPNSPILGDINADCTVNSLDIAMLANDWMCDCNTPSIFNDPNHNCAHGTDSDKNSIVNFKDLQVIINYWLFGTMQGVIEE